MAANDPKAEVRVAGAVALANGADHECSDPTFNDATFKSMCRSFSCRFVASGGQRISLKCTNPAKADTVNGRSNVTAFPLRLTLLADEREPKF